MTLSRAELGSRRIVHDSEGTDIIPLLRAQRGARIEANVWRANDQRLNRQQGLILRI